MSLETIFIGVLIAIAILQAYVGRLQARVNHNFNERLEKLENDGWQ